MNFKKNLTFFSLLSFTPLLATSIVSCSTTENPLKSYEKVEEFKKNFQKPLFTAPSTLEPIKSIISIPNTSLELFISNVKKYLVLAPEFEQLLTENNNAIFRSIKQINISPMVGATNVKVFMFFDSAQSDSNVIFEEIPNYLSTPFAYAQEIKITKKNITQPLTVEEFNAKLSALNNNDLSLLQLAFNIDHTSLDVVNKHFSDFSFAKTADYKIKFKIKDTGINQGYIFNVNNTYYPEIESNKLVK